MTNIISSNYLYNLLDPKVVGPGIWYLLHIEAILADTDSKMDEYTRRVKIICSTFPCISCRYDCCSRLQKNSPNAYKDKYLIVNGKMKRLGMFQWSVDTHNDVNIKLGKPTMNINDAYILYTTLINNGKKDLSSI